MSKQKPGLIFDLDDTLANLSGGFADFLAEAHDKPEWVGREKHWIHYPSLNPTYPGVDIHQSFLDFEASGGMAALEPTLICKMARAYAAAGVPITVITARQWMKNGPGITQAWLKKYDIPTDHIEIVGLHESKKEHVARMIAEGKAFNGVFEDNTQHIQDLGELLPHVFVVDQPWNRHVKNNFTGKPAVVRVFPRHHTA